MRRMPLWGWWGTCLLLVSVILLRTGIASGGDITLFVVDPSHSQVTFTLGATLHTVRGTFRVTRGHLRLEGTTGRVSGECVVAAGSGDSGNRARDRTMRHEVLASTRFPDIMFHPTQMHGTLAPEGLSTVDIDGTLSLNGVAHPLTITATVTLLGDRFTLATHFRIPYVAWGVPDPSTFLLSVEKHVDIRFEAVGAIRHSRLGERRCRD